jgi:hypothetical protein
MSDRVSERRRAAQLARHYRDQEGLTIAEIAHRLGRADATVKAYLYDPSDASKRPTDSPHGFQVAEAFLSGGVVRRDFRVDRLTWHGPAFVGVGNGPRLRG